MNFEKLNLLPQVQQALHEQEYEKPTPIQEQAIPHLLAGRDLFGSAQTGTGKTAAFCIPMLQLLSVNRKSGERNIRALILAPTRELALQIGDSLRTYGKHLSLQHTVIYGGVPQRQQTDALRRGVDIVVATPGRLLDLINQNHLRLNNVEQLVLDEADRMLDMGFINDIRKIIARLPHQRQTVMFSATLPQEIRSLVAKTLNNPVHIELSHTSSSAETVKQSLYYVDRLNKRNLLRHILKEDAVERALVFARTKHGADKLAFALRKEGIRSEAIHGNKSQGQRQRSLQEFKNRKLRVLVATDVAARGIDVDDLTHVINYDMPEVPETYVHRIGRTGRAGAAGIALSFCGFDEMGLLKDIHRHLRVNIPIVSEHPFVPSANIKSEIEKQAHPGNPQRPVKTNTAFGRKRHWRGNARRRAV